MAGLINPQSSWIPGHCGEAVQTPAEAEPLRSQHRPPARNQAKGVNQAQYPWSKHGLTVWLAFASPAGLECPPGLLWCTHQKLPELPFILPTGTAWCPGPSYSLGKQISICCAVTEALASSLLTWWHWAEPKPCGRMAWYVPRQSSGPQGHGAPSLHISPGVSSITSTSLADELSSGRKTFFQSLLMKWGFPWLNLYYWKSKNHLTLVGIFRSVTLNHQSF